MAEEAATRDELADAISRCNNTIGVFKMRVKLHRAEMMGLEQAIGQVEMERATFLRRLAGMVDAGVVLEMEGEGR